ncbi:hypothetical protein PIB30_088733 [Stylosanthes scabra]|uniref:Putative plant transposon protein domain-containing protein n=1 Tax=Stylosanthes scabra TaxID=79078 RepID=A0ABU6YVM6_9FABA|nr:hypothetical protein [Stylosanthes scabra]
MEQIALRGWRRLAAPRTDISKLLVQEFYANAAVSDEKGAAQEELPYKSFVRSKEIDFSPNNIRRVMRFKREIAGALTDYKTRQALNQRLDEMEAILEKRISNHNNKTSHHNKIISHNNMVFPTFSHTMKANTMRPSKASNHTYQACSFSNRPSMRTCKNPKRITWRRSSK